MSIVAVEPARRGDDVVMSCRCPAKECEGSERGAVQKDRMLLCRSDRRMGNLHDVRQVKVTAALLAIHLASLPRCCLIRIPHIRT